MVRVRAAKTIDGRGKSTNVRPILSFPAVRAWKKEERLMRLLLFLGCLIIDTLLLLTYCMVPGPHLLQAQERAAIIDSDIIVVASQLTDCAAELNPKAGQTSAFIRSRKSQCTLQRLARQHIDQNSIQPNQTHPSLTAGPNNEYSTLDVVIVI